MRIRGAVITGRPDMKDFSPKPARGRFAASVWSLRALSALALCAASLLTISAGVARAEVPALILYGQFHTEGGLGVAVDQATGDVFTAGLLEYENATFRALGHSQKFEFDALGRVGASSSFGGMFESSVAVDPAAEHVVYELDAVSSEVIKYDTANGEPLDSFSVPPSGNLPFAGTSLNAVQIATDSEGNVYVPVVPENEVLEYSESKTEPGKWEVIKTFTGGSGADALQGPTGVTVDSAGDVWVADAGNDRIEELSPSGTPMTKIRSVGVTGLALDAHGDVLATVDNTADFCGELLPPCDHLLEYNTAGTQIADVGAGDFGPSSEADLEELPSMVAVNESNGRVYVTDMGKNLIWVFGSPMAPVVSSELVAEVGTSEAKLGALVNPGGIGTKYRFEYGRTAEYGQSVPFPEGSVGEELVSRTVWAAAKGLAPGTTYHYRVVASNALGTDYGRDQTWTTETAAESSCPNEPVRGGFSASLPDCRAYELVTPSNDASAQPDPEHPPIGKYPAGGGLIANQAARDGDRMAFASSEVLPGSPSGGVQYVATRGANGWSTEDVVPLESYTADRCTAYERPVVAYSADLSKTLLLHSFGGGGAVVDGGEHACDVEPVEVVKGEPLGLANLLLRDNTTGSYQLVDVTPVGIKPVSLTFLAASADLEHVVFSENAQLTPTAPAGAEDVYEWSGGGVRLVTVLPDGSSVVGKLVGMSADGSDVLFTANGALYARLHGERTVQLDAAQGGPGVSGGGSVQYVSEDGAQVFFSDASRLTSDSTASLSEPDLYECEIVEVAEGPRCDLSDFTVATKVPGGTFSEDGSHVYFTSNAVLASNTRQYTTTEGKTVVEQAQTGEENVYVYSAGTISFIARNVNVSQVSPNGEFAAIQSNDSLTGYDNTETVLEKETLSETARPEIFLYSAAAGSLVCVSCKPSGEPPTAGGTDVAQGAPAATQGAIHYLSDNGRLFFETNEALLPADTNGKQDVYEYEDGQLHLISGGTAAGNSILLETSEDGRDVFFLTRQRLLAQDTNEEALAIYDARVNGGFTELVSPPACTTPEGCRAAPAPQPTTFGAPASQTFSGAGNLAPPPPTVKTAVKPEKCKKGFVKKKAKCAKSKSKKKDGKKTKPRQATARKASNDRRAES
jgi:hypothetical protein